MKLRKNLAILLSLSILMSQNIVTAFADPATEIPAETSVIGSDFTDASTDDLSQEPEEPSYTETSDYDAVEPTVTPSISFPQEDDPESITGSDAEPTPESTSESTLTPEPSPTPTPKITPTATPTPTPVVLKTPVISSVKSGVKKAVLRWNRVPKADGYVVYQSTKAAGAYKKIAVLKGSAVSYTATRLKDGGTYYYKIRASKRISKKTVYSSLSRYKSCKTATAAPKISQTVSGSKKITIKWSNVSGENRYQLYMASSVKGTYSYIGSTGANVCHYTKTGLKPGKTYYFKVRTYCTSNGQKVFSPFSQIKSGKTKSAPRNVNPASSSKLQTVTLTQSGSKYHRPTCPTLSRSRNLRTLSRSEAEAKGYSACKVCKP